MRKKAMLFATTTFVIISLGSFPTAGRGPFDSSTLTGLTLIGDAAQSGGVLRLTSAAADQAGAAWCTKSQYVQYGFETAFQFRISQTGGLNDEQGHKGGDGFAFVIQNSELNALGAGGAGMGYSFIPNALAIEFDTWWNHSGLTGASEVSDPNDNHIGVHRYVLNADTARELNALARVTPIIDMSDANVHSVRIMYNPPTMQIFLDNMAAPVLMLDIDLGNMLTLDHGRAFVGFTAGTALAWENHDVLNWSFKESLFFGDVQALVSGGVLNWGQGKALTAKLEAALASLKDGKTNAASGQLQAYLNQVKAFVNAGILTPEQGKQLSDHASQVMSAILVGCSHGKDRSTDQPSLFNLVRNVQVTPDTIASNGGFTRTWYVPATNSLVVTFYGPSTAAGTTLTGCPDHANFYKEYTLEMAETGRKGAVQCAPKGNDHTSLMTGSTFYTVNTYFDVASKRNGWILAEYDVSARTDGGPKFNELVQFPYLLDSIAGVYPKEENGDPMIAYVNGLIDVSSWYMPNPDMSVGHGTHHNFFTRNLTFVDKKILYSPDPDEIPRHFEGSSLVFVDGFYYLVTADLFLGDVIMMKFDIDWHFKESRTLRPLAHWSTGLVFADNRFYLAYLDTSLRQPGMDPFPIFLNVHLAAFDLNWNLIEDVAVTDFSPTNRHMAGRPGLHLFGNRFYVSYDVTTITEDNKDLFDGQAHVSVYQLPDCGPGGRRK
jgi:hypothetical protein